MKIFVLCHSQLGKNYAVAKLKIRINFVQNHFKGYTIRNILLLIANRPPKQ